MFVPLFLAFLASISASEPVSCTKKSGIKLFQSDHPVKGNCEETGLGWTGRHPDLIFDKKDQFFTKWTDFFLQPECVDKICVFIEEKMRNSSRQENIMARMRGQSHCFHQGENEKLIETRENIGQINVTGQNPSNTVLITNQPEDEICKLRGFTSRLVFVPKFFENGNLPCYETTQRIHPIAELPLSAHFLNNKGPVIEAKEDDSGVNIFWRRGMMDTCVKAVDWTVNGSTTRRNKTESLTKIEDRIFIRGNCKAQEVIFTYIFSDDSSFHIDDPTVKLPIQEFKVNKECQLHVVGEEQEGSKDVKTDSVTVIVGVAAFILIVIVIVVIVIMKRKGAKRVDRQDTDENHLYGLYATNSQENLPTESEVIDENAYYGT